MCERRAILSPAETAAINRALNTPAALAALTRTMQAAALAGCTDEELGELLASNAVRLAFEGTPRRD